MLLFFWDSRFALRMNATKITDYFKECFKQKLLRIKFPTNNLLDAYLYLPQEWSSGFQRFPFLKCYDVLEYESRFTIRMDVTKNTDYTKNYSNKNCWELNFLQKTQWTNISISPSEVELKSSKDLPHLTWKNSQWNLTKIK